MNTSITTFPQRTLVTLALIAAQCMTTSALAQSEVKAVGAGGLRTQVSTGDRATPEAKYRTAAMAQRAAPTNQWYSSVMFTQWSEVIHAVPLTFKATSTGLEIGQPEKKIVPTERKDVEVHYPHEVDLRLYPTDFQPDAALLAGHGDWSVKIDFAKGDAAMGVTVMHGSPWAYAQVNQGGLGLALGNAAQAAPWSGHPEVLRITSGAQHFAAFAAPGARWVAEGASWRVVGQTGTTHVSVAALPAADEQTLQMFQASAYLTVSDTRATYQIDRSKGELVTTFATQTQALYGQKAKPMMGLYPHHYQTKPALDSEPVGEMASIRGPIRLIQAAQFQTRQRLRSFVPYWPGLSDPDAKKALAKLIDKDESRARRLMLEIGEGPYWQGKGLQRIALVMGVADQEGMPEVRDDLLDKLKGRAEEWLSGQSKRTYFHYDTQLGTVVSYPEEYDAVKDMNDHHFHYGYWIRAAAEIGLRDPQWIAPQAWGPMVDELVRDIATAERSRKDFPYLRNFDPYEGHSWASGVGISPDGNNQESSSEAINAWAGLMMWGALQGRPDLVDLGAYLYTSEIDSVNHYWFDIHGLTLPPEYLNEEVSMVFGGKLAHNTWWIDEPRQIHGINLLPISASSTYLGESSDFVKRSLKALQAETEIYESRGRRAKPEDIWQDLFAKFLALADPQAGMKSWDRWGSVELGDTRSQTYHFLQSLLEHGTPEHQVSADTPLFQVFTKGNGQRRYMVYNASAQARTVTFSDGFTLQALPRQLNIGDSTSKN
jgi:endoglucanase Acf2